MAETDTAIRITGPLPLNDTNALSQAKVVRLCIFMNVIQTLYRHLFSLEEEETGDEFDRVMKASHRLVTTILLSGVLKEGADAIRDALPDLDEAVAGLEGTGVNATEIKEAHARIKAAVDNARGSQSLFNRILVRMRDDAAFHWRRNEIQQLCEDEAGKNAPYAIVRASGEPVSSVRMLLADEILGRVAFGTSGPVELKAMMQEVRRFGTDVIRVLGTAVPFLMRQRGCVAQPFGNSAAPAPSD